MILTKRFSQNQKMFPVPLTFSLVMRPRYAPFMHWREPSLFLATHVNKTKTLRHA